MVAYQKKKRKKQQTIITIHSIITMTMDLNGTMAILKVKQDTKNYKLKFNLIKFL